MRAPNPGFIRLADVLLAPSIAGMPVAHIPDDVAPVDHGARVSVEASNVRPAEAELSVVQPDMVAGPETSSAIRAARVFEAALRDAFDAVLGDLVRELAVDVVARELRLADVDVANVASRIIAERLAEEPLRLRVAAADAAVSCDLPVVVDPVLEAGDAVLECRSGTIDARLGVRLAAVISAVAR